MLDPATLAIVGGFSLAQGASNIFGAWQQHKYDKKVAAQNQALLREAFVKALDARGRAFRAEHEQAAYTSESIQQDAARALGVSRAQVAGARVSGEAARLLVDQITAGLARYRVGAERDARFRQAAEVDANQAAQIEFQSNLFSAGAGPKPNYGLLSFSAIAGAGAQGVASAYTPD
jgi:hypothetical protein